MVGFELFFATIGSQLRSKNDLLVSVLHFSLIQKEYHCLGIGENFENESENGSELLPNNWNEDQENYVLRYYNIINKSKLLVKCVKVSDVLIVSALVIDGQSNGSTLTIKTNEFITDNFNSFQRAFIDGSVDRVSQILDKEVVSKMKSPSNAKSDSSNTRKEQKERHEQEILDPLAEPPHQPFHGLPNIYGQQRFPPPVGGADLDPFGGGMGGMLMDPRFPPHFGRWPNPHPGLPRGAVPPGARFDPFGPPGVFPNPNPNPRNPRNANPNPDHLPPPDYDDMFM